MNSPNRTWRRIAPLAAPLVAGVVGGSACVQGQHVNSVTVGANVMGGAYVTLNFSQPNKEGVVEAGPSPDADTSTVMNALRSKVTADVKDRLRPGDKLMVTCETNSNQDKALAAAQQDGRQEWRRQICPDKMDPDGKGGVRFSHDPSCKVQGPLFLSQATIAKGPHHDAVACVGSTARPYERSRGQTELECEALTRSEEELLTIEQEKRCRQTADAAAEVCKNLFRSIGIEEALFNCNRAVELLFDWDTQNGCVNVKPEMNRRIQKYSIAAQGGITTERQQRR